MEVLQPIQADAQQVVVRGCRAWVILRYVRRLNSIDDVPLLHA